MTRWRILLAAAMVLGGLGAVTALGKALEHVIWHIEEDKGFAYLYDPNGGEVNYVFGGKGVNAFKPYVNRLLSPKKINPLRDNVADHIHHHGLMFAVAIDGVDFWSETAKCGRQVQQLIVGRFGKTDSMKAEIDWIGPDGKTVMATENRTLELYSRNIDKSGKPVPMLATWRTQLSPPAGAESIKLTGSHYFGLGMRFVKSMDNASTFTFADPNAASLAVRGDEKLTPSAWAACTGAVDGNTVTVAMFDHPDNPRPALWFTMGKQFSYLSATINLWKEPLVVKAVEKLDVCYGVAVWDSKATREQIDAACRQWQKLAPSLKAEKKDKAKD